MCAGSEERDVLESVGHMYYMLTSLGGMRGEPAMLDYEPDIPWRIWTLGQRFRSPPREPIEATIERGDEGVMLELWDEVVSVMSKRLADTLIAAGVSNIDFFSAQVREVKSNKVFEDYVAFNIVGTIAAADLKQSDFSAPDGPMVSVDFDSLTIDESRTRGGLMFRLAESLNGIVVHESVKKAIEAAGIDTLTFLDPQEWAG